MPTKNPKILKKKVAKPAPKKAGIKKISVKKPKVETLKVQVDLPNFEQKIQALPPREKYLFAVGKRKRAIVRVRYYDLGTGEIIVNDMTLEKYFGFQPWIDLAREPLNLTGWQKGRWSIKAQGGGKAGQAFAVGHGMSKMLLQIDPTLRPTLKSAGLLTRDARIKERKKYGLKRARRAPQWQKR
ncbi:MAG: 30S ribosomal protein S9 [Patescibacteria group bacterium]|jgi:small subunit ribosomal protein S9